MKYMQQEVELLEKININNKETVNDQSLNGHEKETLSYTERNKQLRDILDLAQLKGEVDVHNAIEASPLKRCVYIEKMNNSNEEKFCG